MVWCDKIDTSLTFYKKKIINIENIISVSLNARKTGFLSNLSSPGFKLIRGCQNRLELANLPLEIQSPFPGFSLLQTGNQLLPSKMQRIFYTIVAQKRTGFKGSVEQAVAISNNTKNRRLGMTPKEAVAKLRGGEQPVKKTPNRASQKNRAYPVGTIVRALTTQRAKVKPGYKAYKGKHYTAPKKITSVSFYQGYPKYTLDNLKHSKMKKTDPLREKLAEERKKVPQQNQGSCG